MPLIHKKVKVTEQKCVGFECNRCHVKYDESAVYEMQEMLHWHNTGGYDSIWGDGTTVDLTLCQQCTFELFKDIATITQSSY
jgi:hypothetical protein